MGIPHFFQIIIEFVEELRPNHPNVESYTLPKVIYLLNVVDKIKTRDYLTQHNLYEVFTNVLNSPDDNTLRSNNIIYKKFKESYNNGRRSS